MADVIFYVLTMAAAAGLCAALISVLRPALQRYALARPNARSSHRIPTPQGGGIAVLIAAILVLAGAGQALPGAISDPSRIAVVLSAAAVLAVIGAIDDVRPLDPWSRLALQLFAAAAVTATLPAAFTIAPIIPWWIERALMVVGIIWLINVVNFMDGIDWITVAEVVPVTAALAIFGLFGYLPKDATATAVALCGAMIGYAPFNKPTAKLFLGDVGSLPIGLLLAWLLITLAGPHPIAALLLPLYYVADATITLIRRFMRGEALTQAHRSHFYQQAVDKGMGVYSVVGWIFAANLALAVLAGMTLYTGTPVGALCAVCGAGVVGATLRRFARN